MKKTLLIIGGIILAGVAVKAKGLLNFASNLNVFIFGFGKVDVSNNFLSLGIKMRLDNNSNQAVKIERIILNLYMLSNGGFELIGASAPDSKGLLLPANKSTEFTITPEIGIIQLFSALGSSITLNPFKLVNVLKQQNYKIETKITVAGKEVVKEHFLNNPEFI